MNCRTSERRLLRAGLILAALLSPAPALSQLDLRLAGDGAALLRLEPVWSMPFEADTRLAVIGFDGASVSAVDTLMNIVWLIGRGAVDAREVRCDADALWPVSTGLAFYYAVPGELRLCDTAAGVARRVASAEQIPAHLGRGGAGELLVTDAPFGGPTRLLSLEVDDTVATATVPSARGEDGRRFPFSPFLPSARRGRLLALGNSRAFSIALFEEGAAARRVTHVPGFTATPYDDTEIRRILERAPEQARAMLEPRLRTMGKPFFRQPQFDLDDEGNVWLGVEAGDPAEYRLMRVGADGTVSAVRLPAPVRALAHAAGHLAVWSADTVTVYEVAR